MVVSGIGQGETPQSLATPAFAGFPLIAESGTKTALTTGMTTDRIIFDFPLRRDIMAGTEYPGVAKLVSRLIWVHRRCSHRTKAKTAENPSTVRISGGSENEKKQSKMCLTTDLTTYTTTIE